MFKHLDGDVAVIRIGGIFKTADLYEWRGGLYAKFGGGYVRLNANGSTTKDGLSIEMLATDEPLYKDRFGRLEIVEGDGSKRVMIEVVAEKFLLVEDKS